MDACRFENARFIPLVGYRVAKVAVQCVAGSGVQSGHPQTASTLGLIGKHEIKSKLVSETAEADATRFKDKVSA